MKADSAANSGGHLLENLLHFGRLLRSLGLRVSTQQVADLAEALTWVDATRREDFYHAARCLLIHAPEDRELFDQAFNLFWAGKLEWVVEIGIASRRRAAADSPDPPESDEPLLGRGPSSNVSPSDQGEEEGRPGVSAIYSPFELLYHRDFADLTPEEIEAVRRFMESLIWRVEERLTRRRVRSAGRAAYLDLPRVIRGSMRQGGEIIKLAWRRRKTRPRPLVVICDISGSMEQYSRLFLHFMYALVQRTRRVEVFVFGTRLTRITPALRQGDVDAALRKTSELVVDWSGGTRIGESLRTFNYRWSRRVLGRGTVALIISDGWDRGDIGLLEREISRLHRSVSRLIWLNPLLGAPGYQPLVRGIRAILPHVDDFLPLHNLATLEQLAVQLGTFSAGEGRPRRPFNALLRSPSE
ncbi:MAG TPA: VWA domain-containing protein [Chloroflexi bacterium]|nr:VWA domain-containing protein [Chloroflexota bacterium]